MRASAWGSPAFVDGFDGVALGPAWEHRIQFHNPWGGRACSKGDPSAVVVGGGTVRLSVLPDPELAGETCTSYDEHGRPTGTHTYRLNGHISTQSAFDFQYGVAAARIRFQRQRGQHGAFWMQPRGLLETGPTPWGAEIDVVEWYGAARGRERMLSAVHRHAASGDELTSVGGRDREPRPLPGRQERPLVDRVPRVLGGVDPARVRVPDRRPGDHPDHLAASPTTPSS